MKLVSFENLSKYNELLSQKTVRSVNSIKPDASGNVLLGTEKSTFNKVVYDTGYFSITTNKTYSFDLTGSDLENVSKENVNIRLVAKVTTAHYGFEVGDIAQITTGLDANYTVGYLDVCSYIRGNTLYVYSGSNSSLSVANHTSPDHPMLKANVQIKAVLTAFIPDDGSILLIAEDQTNTSKLIGLPNGTLTWKDKNIVRSVNNVPADASGNVEIQVGGSTAGDSIIARLRFEDIGTAGQKGFGQSACSDEIRVKELGFRALQGTVDPDSDNYYGVYEHEYAGLCCYIPKFWVRIGNENAPQYSVYKNNSIEIASGDTFNSEEEAKTQGYFLPRAFIDGGEIKRGFFLQKYNSRVSSSNRADGKNYPTSYITNNNLVSITPPNMIDRAKLLGDNWNVATCFMLAAHQLLTLSLAQMAKWYTWCKWYKPTQNYQYPTIGLSATNEGLYTHNGMPNGISGLSYVWQFCTGITTAGTSATQGQTAVTSNDIYLLKKEKSFTELTSGFGGNTDAWGTSSSLLSMYDKYTSPLTLTTNRKVRWGNGEYDVLTNGYNKDTGNIVELDRSLCGVIPKDDNAISSNGSNQMASSLIYQNPVTQNLAFYFGGQTVAGDNEPCFSRYLTACRTLSFSTLGFRCACYA